MTIEKEGNTMEPVGTLVAEAFRSPEYLAVRRRIFRQLLESLIYEGVLRPEVKEAEGTLHFRLEGRTEDGEPVEYRFTGERMFSFGRIRLGPEPVRRVAGGQSREADSLTRFLLETCRATGADRVRLTGFARELEETLCKDTVAQYVRRRERRTLRDQSVDALEGELMDGHPYHPSYKSRIGFDLRDHLEYGPEFRRLLYPIWLAVRRDAAKMSVSAKRDPDVFLRDQLGEETVARFTRTIRGAGKDPGDYLFLPVHPWQWRKKVSALYPEDFREGRILFLGASQEAYRAQQSIRTLANADAPEKPYLKLSLSILNTSTERVLAPHTVLNAPRVTDWLQGILAEDPFLRDEQRLILLGEVMGISYDPPVPSEWVRDVTYGVLGCIWRESLHLYLSGREEAVPFNGLCCVDLDGTPLIDPWIRRWGAEDWTKALLKVSITPLVHLLYAHGIGMEAHAQNMVLIHEKGFPKRLALKDFHDGIRFSRKHLRDPDRCPELIPTPAFHARVNRNSFIETDDPRQVADFMHDAFFFINLSELALFLRDRYGMEERRFWEWARETIRSYQERFPEMKERYRLFDLFAPTVDVEQLTKRRLFPDTEIRIHPVPNALAEPAKERSGEGCRRVEE